MTNTTLKLHLGKLKLIVLSYVKFSKFYLNKTI